MANPPDRSSGTAITMFIGVLVFLGTPLFLILELPPTLMGIGVVVTAIATWLAVMTYGMKEKSGARGQADNLNT